MLVKFNHGHGAYIYVNPDQVASAEKMAYDKEETYIRFIDGNGVVVNELLDQVVKKLNEELERKRS